MARSREVGLKKRLLHTFTKGGHYVRVVGGDITCSVPPVSKEQSSSSQVSAPRPPGGIDPMSPWPHVYVDTRCHWATARSHTGSSGISDREKIYLQVFTKGGHNALVSMQLPSVGELGPVVIVNRLRQRLQCFAEPFSAKKTHKSFQVSAPDHQVGSILCLPGLVLNTLPLSYGAIPVEKLSKHRFTIRKEVWVSLYILSLKIEGAD